MREYIKTLTFKLTDLKKTQETYRDYKTKEFNQLMKTCKESVKVHFKYLNDDIANEFYNKSRRFFFDCLDLTNKMDVRFLKTNINHVCQEINQNFIESIVHRPNKNKIKCFAIRFYLKYYTKINQIMHDTLESIMNLEGGNKNDK